MNSIVTNQSERLSEAERQLKESLAKAGIKFDPLGKKIVVSASGAIIISYITSVMLFPGDEGDFTIQLANNLLLGFEFKETGLQSTIKLLEGVHPVDYILFPEQCRLLEEQRKAQEVLAEMIDRDLPADIEQCQVDKCDRKLAKFEQPIDRLGPGLALS